MNAAPPNQDVEADGHGFSDLPFGIEPNALFEINEASLQCHMP